MRYLSFRLLITNTILLVALFGFMEYQERSRNWNAMQWSHVQGARNTAIYFKYKHQEPSYAWMIQSSIHGPIDDSEQAVDDIDIKAQAWSVDHLHEHADIR